MTETIAVVFTDLVDSTRLLSSLGDDAFDGLRREHFAVLREAIAQHGGTEVKNLGDGLMAVFRSASDAITAAVAMQVGSERQGRRDGSTEVGLKVGASIGDATPEEGDWFGTPVVEAARLCALATSGQLLITDLTRMMAGSRSGERFEPIGLVDLKGLPDPVAVCQVCWEAAAPVDRAPLPGALAAASALPFAGRAKALAALEGARSAAEGGSARTVFIAGEPGIGKTRLAAQVCHELHDHGAVVLLGRSEDEIDVPFRPFSEALQQLVRHASDEVIEDHVAAVGATLATLVPALAQRMPTAPAIGGGGVDGDAQRLQLFHAVADLLRRQSEVAPLVLVLDDVHWADRSSLLLLRHLVDALAVARLLILATYRDTDLDRSHPLANVLADFRRVASVERLSLDGLSQAEVIEYLAVAGGHDLEPEGVELGRQLAEITDGNPFFLTETLRHLAEEGAIVERDGRWVAGDVTPEEVGVPEGIREVVGRRLSALDDETEQLLRVAAVAGAHFDSGVVAAVAGMPDDAVVDALDVACTRSLTAEDTDRFGWYRFAHALVRQTLLEELSTTKRIRMHLALGAELERRAPDRVEEIAHHYLEAAAAGAAAKAVEFATRAGKQAMERSAPEQAVRWFDRALEAEESLAPDPVRRCELLLDLGEARNWMQEFLEAAPGILEAAELARGAGRSDLLALAAFHYLGPWGFWVDMADVHRGPLLAEALAALRADEHPELRVRLLIKQWSELQFETDGIAQDAVAAEVLALARTIDDPIVRWEGLLYCSGAYQSRPETDLQDELIAEALAVEGIGALRKAETTGVNRCGARRNRGDFVGAREDAAHYRDLAERSGATIVFAALGEPSSRATVEGRFEDARTGFDLIRAGVDNHLQVLSALAGGMWVDLWTADAERFRSELDALPEATLAFANGYPIRSVERLLADDVGEARTLWEVWKPMLDFIPRFARSHLAAWSTYPAWRLGDAAVARRLVDILRPFSGSWSTPNQAVCNGPMDLHIGVNLLTLGQLDESEALVRSAVADASRCGAPTWQAYGSFFHALVLRELGRATEAAEVATTCRDLAAGFGMDQVLLDLDRAGLAVGIDSST